MVAQTAAQRSPDPSTKVGASVCLDENYWVIGYNHLCRGTPDEWVHERELKYPHIVHAEEVLVTCLGREYLEGQTVFVTAFPCSPCGKLLVAAGVARVMAILEPSYEARWSDSVKESQDRFNRAGVEYRVYERKQHETDSGQLVESPGRDVGGKQRPSWDAGRRVHPWMV